MSVAIRRIWLVEVEQKNWLLLNFVFPTLFLFLFFLFSFLFNTQFLVEQFSKTFRDGIRLVTEKAEWSLLPLSSHYLPFQFYAPPA